MNRVVYLSLIVMAFTAAAEQAPAVLDESPHDSIPLKGRGVTDDANHQQHHQISQAADSSEGHSNPAAPDHSLETISPGGVRRSAVERIHSYPVVASSQHSSELVNDSDEYDHKYPKGDDYSPDGTYEDHTHHGIDSEGQQRQREKSGLHRERHSWRYSGTIPEESVPVLHHHKHGVHGSSEKNRNDRSRKHKFSSGETRRHSTEGHEGREGASHARSNDSSRQESRSHRRGSHEPGSYESGSNESGSHESRSHESGSHEQKRRESGSNGSGSHERASENHDYGSHSSSSEESSSSSQEGGSDEHHHHHHYPSHRFTHHRGHHHHDDPKDDHDVHRVLHHHYHLVITNDRKDSRMAYINRGVSEGEDRDLSSDSSAHDDSFEHTSKKSGSVENGGVESGRVESGSEESGSEESGSGESASEEWSEHIQNHPVVHLSQSGGFFASTLHSHESGSQCKRQSAEDHHDNDHGRRSGNYDHSDGSHHRKHHDSMGHSDSDSYEDDSSDEDQFHQRTHHDHDLRDDHQHLHHEKHPHHLMHYKYGHLARSFDDSIQNWRHFQRGHDHATKQMYGHLRGYPDSQQRSSEKRDSSEESSEYADGHAHWRLRFQKDSESSEESLKENDHDHNSHEYGGIDHQYQKQNYDRYHKGQKYHHDIDEEDSQESHADVLLDTHHSKLRPRFHYAPRHDRYWHHRSGDRAFLHRHDVLGKNDVSREKHLHLDSERAYLSKQARGRSFLSQGLGRRHHKDSFGDHTTTRNSRISLGEVKDNLSSKSIDDVTYPHPAERGQEGVSSPVLHDIALGETPHEDTLTENQGGDIVHDKVDRTTHGDHDREAAVALYHHVVRDGELEVPDKNTNDGSLLARRGGRFGDHPHHPHKLMHGYSRQHYPRYEN